LEALGLGHNALITDLRKVRPSAERTIAASGTDPTELVVAFLGQLLLLQQVEGFLVRSIHARAIGTPPTSVLATVRGEPFDLERHPQRVEVKAVTLHRLAFDPAKGRARVILDI
jgi:SHS2 domain-containing protein